ncbi:hypothetical protein ZWY2020_015119 [Hordeum vulgare]|nr:hypothetical protein ZWY2020_015119 [Hordeum vulgare]
MPPRPSLPLAFLLLLAARLAGADDPYRYFTWIVTYGPINPLGTTQQERDQAAQELMAGRRGGDQLPHPARRQLHLQVPGQGPDRHLHLLPLRGAAPRRRGVRRPQRLPAALHPRPLPLPAGDFTLLVGDWYLAGHDQLRQTLDSGAPLPFPDALLINGMPSATLVGDQGRTYLLRVSNVGMKTSINFRIQGHSLRLAEVEGTHPVQNVRLLDVHVGQSVAFLVTLDQPPMDYAVVASTRFNPADTTPLTAVGTLHYSSATSMAPGPLPAGPPEEIEWSMNQARSFRWNLTASAARPNPQGSFHYGTIQTSRTLVLASSAPVVAGQRRYAVNGVSFVVPDTPLKLLDNYNIANMIEWDSVPERPDGGAPRPGTPVVRLNLHEFVEVVFQNTENEMQSWHLDGYDFWVVGYGNGGQWTENERLNYNLVDAQARHTVQVYPNGWSAILVSLDNQGMWNLRSANWDRQYRQQLYLRVWTAEQSFSNEYSIPTNAILCGRAAGLPH